MPTENSLKITHPAHYYGYIVRRFFIAAGIIMLITFPIFHAIISLPGYLTIAAVLLVSFFAGLESPKVRWIAAINTALALAGCAIFEIQAVNAFHFIQDGDGFGLLFFIVNQFLALLFFIAGYYSSKTVRAMFLVKDVQ